MRFMTSTAILLALSFAEFSQAEKLAKPLFRHATYANAWDSSKESGKPMLVFITMEDCHFCNKMKAETLARRNIHGTVSTAYESVSIHRSQRPDLVKKFGVKIFPTTFIVDADGKIIDRMEGFVSPQRFAKHLRPAQRTAQAGSTP